MLTHAITETLESVTHHHSIGTLWRDSDDTVSFHTNLNTTHTEPSAADPASPRTAPGAAHHALAPHPPLDRCHAAAGVGVTG